MEHHVIRLGLYGMHAVIRRVTGAVVIVNGQRRRVITGPDGSFIDWDYSEPAPTDAILSLIPHPRHRRNQQGETT